MAQSAYPSALSRPTCSRSSATSRVSVKLTRNAATSRKIGGSVRLKIEDEVLELGQYDAVRIPGPMMRALEGGPEGAEVIAFGAPNTDNKDAEMVPGWWAD